MPAQNNARGSRPRVSRLIHRTDKAVAGVQSIKIGAVVAKRCVCGASNPAAAEHVAWQTMPNVAPDKRPKGLPPPCQNCGRPAVIENHGTVARYDRKKNSHFWLLAIAAVVAVLLIIAKELLA